MILCEVVGSKSPSTMSDAILVIAVQFFNVPLAYGVQSLSVFQFCTAGWIRVLGQRGLL